MEEKKTELSAFSTNKYDPFVAFHIILDMKKTFSLRIRAENGHTSSESLALETPSDIAAYYQALQGKAAFFNRNNDAVGLYKRYWFSMLLFACLEFLLLITANIVCNINPSTAKSVSFVVLIVVVLPCFGVYFLNSFKKKGEKIFSLMVKETNEMVYEIQKKYPEFYCAVQYKGKNVLRLYVCCTSAISEPVLQKTTVGDASTSSSEKLYFQSENSKPDSSSYFDDNPVEPTQPYNTNPGNVSYFDSNPQSESPSYFGEKSMGGNGYDSLF